MSICNPLSICSWGSNSHGQLGQGIKTEQIEEPKTLKTFDLDDDLKGISGGGKHTIIFKCDNWVYGCGDIGTPGCNPEYHFVRLFCRKIRKVCCGWDFTLVLTEDQDVLGWGSNSFGQLGQAKDKVSHVYKPIKIFDEKAISIAAGLRHSAVVGLDKFVFTCGFGRKGQLGVLSNNSTPEYSDKFIQVKNISNVIEVSCGEAHTLAVVKTQEELHKAELFAWGNNKFGQFGINSVSSSSLPIKTQIFEGKIKSLSSGWSHNCLLKDNGNLVTWGRNDFGQLGREEIDTWKPEPILIEYKFIQVCLSSHHCLALTDSGEVFTWGWNEHGNCGVSSDYEVIKKPKLIMTGIKMIGCGYAHSFAVKQCEESVGLI